MIRCRLAERSRCRDATSMAGVMWSARYRGACPCKQRYVMRPSLKVTLSGTCNQCSSSCRSVDKPRSNFRVSIADYSVAGVEHSLQFIRDRLQRSCIDSVAIVNAWRHESMHESCCRSIVERSPDECLTPISENLREFLNKGQRCQKLEFLMSYIFSRHNIYVLNIVIHHDKIRRAGTYAAIQIPYVGLHIFGPWTRCI